VVLNMEMPGVAKENLNIRVDNDRLIIDGLKSQPLTKGNFRLKEIFDGDFHMEYTIDDTVDRNKIEAMTKNGIVTLKLGIKESEKPRKISVNVK
jgi:HSP20 family protein